MVRPLSTPMALPTNMPASAASSGGQPSRNVTAVTTLVSAMTEPTDRSMPPLMMMRVMPSAPMATMTVWARTTRRFVAER